jgi:hypothetical protein
MPPASASPSATPLEDDSHCFRLVILSEAKDLLLTNFGDRKALRVTLPPSEFLSPSNSPVARFTHPAL